MTLALRFANFGAINGLGGEKRLNVAITRARRELHVFSSIRAEQIDLDRTRAVGVRDLKAFLDYAERGSIALPSRDEGSLGPAENPFEEAVADALRTIGWEIRTQIGVSGFRVDLGVVHPDYAGRYLAGIECDGASYHSSATARDRDKVRQAVLEDLGWTILRVWSTDWFRNPPTVADRLHVKLVQLLEADREAATVEDGAGETDDGIRIVRGVGDDAKIIRLAPSEPEYNQLAEEDEAAADVQGDLPGLIVDSDEVSGTVLSTISESGSGAGDLSIAAAPISQTGSSEDLISPSTAGEVTNGHQEDGTADPDRFFDFDYAPVLRRLIHRIVEREAPITLHGLARKVAQEHGWQRTGKRIQTRVKKSLSSVERHSEFDTVFVWVIGSHSDRVPFRGLNGRPIREVSRTEIGSVIDAHAHDLANEEDPILALSRLLGIARLSKDARAYLSDCARWREENAAAAQSLQPTHREERSDSVVDRDEGERRAPTQAPPEQHAGRAAAGQDDLQYGLEPADRDAGSTAAAPPRARRDEETDELDWDDVESFFYEYGCVMMNHPELRWFQESWGALLRTGLASCTRYEDYEHAQTLLKLRAICLLAMYLGIYQQGSDYGPQLGGYFNGHPGIWEYLEAFKVDDKSLWEMARIDGYLSDGETGGVEEHDDEEAEDEDERAEILRDAVLEWIREENDSIYKVLEAHYGGAVGLFASLWNSRKSLHRVDPHEDVVNPTLPPNAGLDYLFTSPELGEMAEVHDYVESGMRDWELDSSC